MMKIFRYLLPLLFCCLFSCAPDKTQVEAKNNASTHKIHIPKESKPGAPIYLVSPTILTINANEIRAFEITLNTPFQQGQLKVDLIPDDGLILIDTSLTQIIDIHEAKITIPVNVKVSLDGRYYLNLRLETNDDSGLVYKSLAVIVQVGPEHQTNQSVLKKASGEQVQSFNAQETISH